MGEDVVEEGGEIERIGEKTGNSMKYITLLFGTALAKPLVFCDVKSIIFSHGIVKSIHNSVLATFKNQNLQRGIFKFVSSIYVLEAPLSWTTSFF